MCIYIMWLYTPNVAISGKLWLMMPITDIDMMNPMP